MQILARCVFIVVALFLISHASLAYAIAINTLAYSLHDDQINIQCEVEYQLDDKVKEALRNGIEMNFRIEIELMSNRLYLLDSMHGRILREFKIKYHALSKQFITKDAGSDIERSFPDLYSAFYYQRYIHNALLDDLDPFKEGKQYYLRARARLVSEQLPLPLRIKSYLSKSWRPSSGWTIWPI